MGSKGVSIEKQVPGLSIPFIKGAILYGQPEIIPTYTCTLTFKQICAFVKHKIATDGYKVYLDAVESAFGCDVDYAMLVKIYGKTQEEIRYSPADCLAAEKRIITGNPDEKHVSTSYVERQNLTMRMSMRRFTRLTNAFSKKLENHIHAISLHYMYYNFCRVHQTLRCTPAMEAGVTKRLWKIEDIVALLD